MGSPSTDRISEHPLSNLWSVRRCAALLAATLALGAAGAPTDPPDETSDARYETVRISRPDGSVVEVRVRKGQPATVVSRSRTTVTRAGETTTQITSNDTKKTHAPRGVKIRRAAPKAAGVVGSGEVARISRPAVVGKPGRDGLSNGGSGGALGDGPGGAVAGDDAGEWDAGRGWVPGGEDDDRGDFADMGLDGFQVIAPGRGFEADYPGFDAVGDPGADGYDAQAIARWNVVPHQEVVEDFRVGVVAFHREGIDYVDFSLDDGETQRVSTPRFNARTQTWEYGVTVRPSILPRDGQIELRAVVYPNVGQPRVLAGPLDGSMQFQNGEHSLFLTVNSRGTLPNPEYYCSPTGNDDSGDGTEANPFETPGRAFRQATQDHGSADGAVCYLQAGNYPWGPKPWPLIETSERWPVMMPAPGVSRDEVIIDTGPVGGFSTSLMSARNVTITGDQTVRGGGMIWLDGVRAIGPGPEGEYNSRLFQGATDFVAEYITNSEVSHYRNGVREATLTRETQVHTCWGVPFGQTGLLVNSEAWNVGDMGTGSHGDILRWLLDSDERENYIAFGVHAVDSDVQGIFAEVHDGYTKLDDIAMVNVHISKDADSDNGSWWEPETNHLLMWHCSLPDQPFRWAQEDYNTSVRNVSIVGSIVGAFTHTRLSSTDTSEAFVNHIHYVYPDWYGAFFVGFDRSFGDPGFFDPDTRDYRLRADSPLNDRMQHSSLVVQNDISGVRRQTLTAIGAYDESVDVDQ